MAEAMLAEIHRRMKAETPSNATLATLADRAAVVGSFSLDWLNAQRPGGDDPRARSAVLEMCDALDPGLGRWRIQQHERVSRLQTMLGEEGDKLGQILDEAAPMPDDSTGITLQAMLRGEQHDLNQTEDLAPIFEAATLLKGVEGAFLDPRSVRREMSRRQLTEQLAGSSNRFVGRETEVQRLTEFLTGAPPADPSAPIPMLAIHGIGGIGKSALIARVLSGLIRSGTPLEGTAQPLTKFESIIFSLDFDRVGLDPTHHPELGFELTRQIALLHPKLEADMDRIRRDAKVPYIQQRAQEAQKSGDRFNYNSPKARTQPWKQLHFLPKTCCHSCAGRCRSPGWQTRRRSCCSTRWSACRSEATLLSGRLCNGSDR